MAVVPIRSGFLRNLRRIESRVQGSTLRTILGLQKPTSDISPNLSGTVGEFFETKVTPPLQFLREPAQQVAEAFGGLARPSTFLEGFAVGGAFKGGRFRPITDAKARALERKNNPEIFADVFPENIRDIKKGEILKLRGITVGGRSEGKVKTFEVKALRPFNRFNDKNVQSVLIERNRTMQAFDLESGLIKTQSKHGTFFTITRLRNVEIIN